MGSTILFGILLLTIGLLCILIASSFGLWGLDDYEIAFTIPQASMIAAAVCSFWLYRILSSTRPRLIQSAKIAPAEEIDIEVPTISYCLSFDNNKILQGNSELQLTSKEFKLLSILVQRPDEICDYDFLIQQIWPEVSAHPDHSRDQNNLNQLIRAARGKLNIHEYIINHSGRGYEFKQWNPKS